MSRYTNEPMLDMFIFETSQLIEQLEQSILDSEKTDSYTSESINEIFRIMHTIKGSSAMMLFNNISSLAHSIEDLFYFLREEKPQQVDYSALSDLVFESIDFIKLEIEKIKNGDNADGYSESTIENIRGFLDVLKQLNCSANQCENKREPSSKKVQYYISQAVQQKSSYRSAFKAIIYLEENCQMENIRAYTIIDSLNSISQVVRHIPERLIEDDDSIQVIREQGLEIYFNTDKPYNEIHEYLKKSPFLKDLELSAIDENEEMKSPVKVNTITLEENEIKVPEISKKEDKASVEKDAAPAAVQSFISVPVLKLDKLMDLIGELVIAEAMVTQNPDLKGLELDNFNKAARQLKKITGELQDTVMSVRMVPLTSTFQKMHRIVRDMSKKLNKEIKLEILGEETEVDKNIIEHISDPIMHLVRNAIDHGIESAEERIGKGKGAAGTVTLEAYNAGNDVVITIKDDGKGLNKQKILDKAKKNNLIFKTESDMTEKEIYNLIFLPGFSTKDEVTEFSGRGVGMDVVIKNIEMVGGSITINSKEHSGTTIAIKIPLTLAIVDGMNIRVGKACYTIPTIAIKQSFRPVARDIITDPDGKEMIMVRGKCFPIIRLHETYRVKQAVQTFSEGIIIMVEHEGKVVCLFADELLGEQQVVVKNLPVYIKNIRRINGISGCTLLGDGSISLILDVVALVGNK